jgi:hypothetical protein
VIKRGTIRARVLLTTLIGENETSSLLIFVQVPHTARNSKLLRKLVYFGVSKSPAAGHGRAMQVCFLGKFMRPVAIQKTGACENLLCEHTRLYVNVTRWHRCSIE